MQYIIYTLNSLSKYKEDSYYNASVDCFIEQLKASKVLLIKEPLEALDGCDSSPCYNDVDIEMELTIEEIVDQMKKCLDYVNARGPLYDDLINVIKFVDVHSKTTIDMLIDKLKTNNKGIYKKTLHQLITIERKLENGSSVTVNRKNEHIVEFVKKLLA